MAVVEGGSGRGKGVGGQGGLMVTAFSDFRWENVAKKKKIPQPGLLGEVKCRYARSSAN